MPLALDKIERLGPLPPGPNPEPGAAHAPIPGTANHAEPGTESTRRATPVWLQRLSLFVLVLFCVYLGVLAPIAGAQLCGKLLKPGVGEGGGRAKAETDRCSGAVTSSITL